MAAVTICSDFGAQKNSLTLFPLFPHLFPMKWWDRMPWSSFSECWALSQLFHSPLSLSSRGFQFLFTFCHKGGVICISEVIDISPSNLDSSLYIHTHIHTYIWASYIYIYIWWNTTEPYKRIKVYHLYNMDGLGGHHAKWNKLDKDTHCTISLTWGI